METKKTFGREVEDLVKKHLSQFEEKGYEVNVGFDYQSICRQEPYNAARLHEDDSVGRVEIYALKTLEDGTKSRVLKADARFRAYIYNNRLLMQSYGTKEFDEAFAALGADWEKEGAGRQSVMVEMASSSLVKKEVD